MSVINSSKLLICLILLTVIGVPRLSFGFGTKMVRKTGHLLPNQVAKATHLGRVSSDELISLSISLNIRDQQALQDLIHDQSTPGNPRYGKFLTPEQFAESFSPSQADYDELANYLSARGLHVTTKHSNRLVIDVSATALDIEQAFQTELHLYKTSDGRQVRSPNSEPAIESSVAKSVAGIVGLSNFAKHHHYANRANLNHAGQGTGPGGALSPQDIRKAYGLLNLTATGAGETVALVEFDGYTASDITKYGNQFSLGTLPPLKNILVDGFNGIPTTGPNSGAIEVTLDIELVIALAPQVSQILVYEAPTGSTLHSFDTAFVDVLNKIAADNLARQVSISWGASEGETEQSALTGENTAFMQMAAQGQAVFVASGDTGANDNGFALAVDNPASQPYVVAVGGTRLKLNSDGSYLSETSWANAASKSGGGGGISKIWPMPTWQSSLATTDNLGSNTKRMIPDVALDADPASGYAISFQNGFTMVGGTSCSAPLWAAFNALVNQKRKDNGLAGIGNPNPAIYRVGQSSIYSKTFLDIADLSKNFYYPAVAGYDLSTGWGSFNGTELFYALTNSILPPMAPTNVKAEVKP